MRLEGHSDARVASLLCDVITWGLHRDLGFRGVDDYAEELLEIETNRTPRAPASGP